MATNFFSSRRLLAVAACTAVTWMAVHALWATQLPANPDKVQYDPFSDLHEALPDATKTVPLPDEVAAINPLKAGRMQPVVPQVEKKDPPPQPNNFKLDDNWKPEQAPANPRGIQDVIKFAVLSAPKEAKRGQLVRVMVVGMPAEHWHTFALTKRAPDQIEPSGVLKFGKTPGFQALPPVEESKPEPFIDPVLKTGAWRHDTRFTWSFDVLVQLDAAPGAQEFPFVVSLQACEKGCIAGKFDFKIPITVLAGDPVPLDDHVKKRMQEKFPPASIVPLPGKVEPMAGKELTGSKVTMVGLPRDYQASMDRIFKEMKPVGGYDGEQSVLAFMLAGMFWGFISLITPCVFPMIPITVSFFLKQSEKEHHKPVMMASVYCGTIVLVLTVAAAALLNFFRVLSLSPLMNFGLGLLFIVFALSLFGMYDIELPSFLGRFTSEREGKGGLVGTIFMALTFTIISFACVAPFLGGFGGTAATVQRPWWHTLLGGFAFSVTFASPFFILALFPTLLKAMPKSGSWLNSVKVVMGFLELAAAFKFFRAGELVNSPGTPSLFTFDFVLGLWIALCLLCGLYLLGIYRLPHDSPSEHVSVPRLLFSFMFLGLGFYLMPALVLPPPEEGTPRPDGAVFAWVNAFLLPEARPGKGAEVWTGNLEHAVAQAREFYKNTGKPKLIFIDFTGVNCANCRKNESSVFTKGEIRKLFQPYLLVQLYTDKVPLEFYAPEDRPLMQSDNARQIHDAEVVNGGFQDKLFQTTQTPLYVILQPMLDGTIKTVSVYPEGLINSESQFAEFLLKPQQQIVNVAQAGM